MPANDVLAKIDRSLAEALSAWEEAGTTDDGISVSLRFDGAIAAIEAVGFQTHWVMNGDALGVVHFRDVAAVALHPSTIRLAAGRPSRRDLDTAAPDIRARATAPISGAPVDGLWHAVVSTGALTKVADGTGSGVIVAVIDTGIDITHPMFMSQLTPTMKTRILRIWDQGMIPTSVAECPPVALLASAQTYGVQFTDVQIDAALNGGAPVKHKDCDGHGTHVAGIAAGGTTFPTGGSAKHVGVAPEASIIAVKYLDNPEKIFFRTSAGSGAEVGWPARFRDAVLYCLRTARQLDKPIVVNMSFGDRGEAGDGLDADARFVDGLMKPGIGPSENNFPTGAVVVKSSGNDAQRNMRIVIPASGVIEVPLRLVDARGASDRTWKQCARNLHKPSLSVHFWYRRPAVGVVTFAFNFPHSPGFGSNVFPGAEHILQVVRRVGPPPEDFSTGAAGTVVNRHRVGLKHEDPGSVTDPSGNLVHRHHAEFFVAPRESGGTISYLDGMFRVRISGPPDTVVWGMGDFESWSSGAIAFRLGVPSDGITVPAGITSSVESSSVDSLGAHVITVASYDDNNGVSGSPQGDIVDSSGRGPLRNFSNPAAPLPVIPKPDIAAPGEDIMSAEGADTEQLLPTTPSWRSGIRFHSLGGTSMAAPMVAGTIALMLDKIGTLNITRVRAILRAAARGAVNPPPGTDGTNAYGGGRIDAMTSHNNTIP